MEDNCDFISQLPDHLLLHIFSFLDETFVFQSSVLSRRWHHLWTLVPFPMHIIEMRSYFKEQKEAIREKKLCEEEEARKIISELPTHIAKSIIHTVFMGLSFTTLQFREFAVILPLFTLFFMRLLYLSCSWRYSRLCGIEGCLKRLQMRDSRLTSNANSQSTTKVPMLELLFPENYEPRYTKSAKVYELIGVLLLIVISCGLIISKLRFDFIHGRGAWVATLSNLGNVGFAVYYLLKTWCIPVYTLHTIFETVSSLLVYSCKRVLYPNMD